MDNESRQILFMLAWLFMQHGREDKAIVLAAALHEADHNDWVSAALFCRLLLGDGRPQEALSAIESVTFPAEERRLRALLEARCLNQLGRAAEAVECWKKFLSSNRRR